MDKNKLKIGLLQKILACDDGGILRKVENILDSPASEVEEAGEGYFSRKNDKSEALPGSNMKTDENFDISAEQEDELMRRVADHANGRGKTLSWEEIKKNIKNIES